MAVVNPPPQASTNLFVGLLMIDARTVARFPLSKISPLFNVAFGRKGTHVISYFLRVCSNVDKLGVLGLHTLPRFQARKGCPEEVVNIESAPAHTNLPCELL